MNMNIHKCTRCTHEWAGRGAIDNPKFCPACKSPYWSRERIHKAIAQESAEHKWATKKQIRRIVADHEKEAEAIA